MDTPAVKVLMCECDVRFIGETQVRFARTPQIGAQGRCILFLRDLEGTQVAEILGQYGWKLLGVKMQRIDADTLGPPSMEPFRIHFDACLKEGHSLVWYS